MEDIIKKLILDIAILTVLAFGSYYIRKYLKTMIIANINNLIQMAEVSIQGSKLGAAKKEWVLEQLENIGIEANETISNLIDELVAIMNERKSSLLDIVTEEIKDVVGQ